MKLGEIYKRVLKYGKAKDPRKNKAGIKEFEDTAILYGSPETEVRRIMVGIDIDPAEIIIADQIRKSDGLDLVISHHPEGSAWAHFYEVMRLQADMLAKVGVSKFAAQKMIEQRMHEVERRVLPNNHTRTVDAARLLDMPLMCVHTPADNQVEEFIYKVMARSKPEKLKDVIRVLRNIPEYKMAEVDNAGPRILAGNPEKPVGRIFVEMTGGTEGSKEVYTKFAKLGIKTIICMHLSEEHFTKVKEANINVIIAGHISSDNLGLNLLLDKVEDGEPLECLECSGFRRVRR
jgi:putative NIF3 family GTP cyclohydrolase 1 type 2